MAHRATMNIGFSESYPLFFRGTLAPAPRASDRPIAIACLRLLTRLPERPLRSAPRFSSCIALRTFLPLALPYLRAIVLSSGPQLATT
jgi:hypothetical protein